MVGHPHPKCSCGAMARLPPIFGFSRPNTATLGYVAQLRLVTEALARPGRVIADRERDVAVVGLRRDLERHATVVVADPDREVALVAVGRARAVAVELVRGTVELWRP